ncbi:MAG TPA: hypothetical protein VFF39_11780, partial [Verrucomicrobiae bacterium]|nr:hypothetical protein [Verrucomicrobiae bacterium]
QLQNIPVILGSHENPTKRQQVNHFRFKRFNNRRVIFCLRILSLLSNPKFAYPGSCQFGRRLKEHTDRDLHDWRSMVIRQRSNRQYALQWLFGFYFTPRNWAVYHIMTIVKLKEQQILKNTKVPISLDALWSLAGSE